MSEVELFLQSLKENKLVLEDPRVSDCSYCYFYTKYIGKDKPCPERELSVIPLSKWSYALKTQMPDKNKYHCTGWKLDTPAIHTLDRPPLAEVEHEPEFVNILPEDNYISRYYNLATGLNDAYPEYHFMCATTIISALIQRKIILELTTDYYPNVYAILVGDSTKSRKTTALDLMRKIIGNAIHFFPDEFSGPSIVDELAERGQGLFHIDEYGEFIAKMTRDYNSGIASFLCKIYDCPAWRRKRLRKETFIITNAYPCIIGGIQPKVLTEYTSVADLATGYPQRIAWLYPTRPKETKPVRKKTNAEKRTIIELYEIVKNYGILFSGATGNISIGMTQEALNKYNTWSEHFEKILEGDPYEELLDSQVGRLKEYALKLAMIFTVADPRVYSFIATRNKTLEKYEKFSHEEQKRILRSAIGDSITEYNNRTTLLIPEKYLDIAIFYIEHMFLHHAKKTAIKICTDHETFVIDRIYEIILKNQAIDRATLIRRAHLKTKDLNDVLETLIGGERIIREWKEMGKGKRKKMTYYALTPDKKEVLKS